MEEEIIHGPEPYPSEVTAVEPLENYKLRITLTDGRKGIFDMTPFLDKGVFKELKDTHYFRRVYVDYGTVVWPHEQDIAPETIEMLLQPEPAPKTKFSIADRRRR
jgi:hypothetical protein